jgi:hypothetical protein
VRLEVEFVAITEKYFNAIATGDRKVTVKQIINEKEDVEQFPE